MTTSAAPRLYCSITSTFTDYNSLSTFLLFAWTVILLAGRPCARVAADGLWPPASWLSPAIIVMSGSREATAACLLAGVVIGQSRYRLPTIRYGLTFFAIAIVEYIRRLDDDGADPELREPISSRDGRRS